MLLCCPSWMESCRRMSCNPDGRSYSQECSCPPWNPSWPTAHQRTHHVSNWGIQNKKCTWKSKSKGMKVQFHPFICEILLSRRWPWQSCWSPHSPSGQERSAGKLKSRKILVSLSQKMAAEPQQFAFANIWQENSPNWTKTCKHRDKNVQVKHSMLFQKQWLFTSLGPDEVCQQGVQPRIVGVLRDAELGLDGLWGAKSWALTWTKCKWWFEKVKRWHLNGILMGKRPAKVNPQIRLDDGLKPFPLSMQFWGASVFWATAKLPQGVQ